MNVKPKSKFAYSIIVGALLSISVADADALYGAELNPFSLGGEYISGGFNVFFPKQAFEIAIPFVYNKHEALVICNNYDNRRDLTVDVVARKYLQFQISSMMPYAGVLLRHRRIMGTYYDSCDSSGTSLPYDITHKTARNAYALNIGIRRITRTGLYIGASISYGQYFDDGIDGAESPFSGSTLRDIEFFKLGYIFN